MTRVLNANYKIYRCATICFSIGKSCWVVWTSHYNNLYLSTISLENIKKRRDSETLHIIKPLIDDTAISEWGIGIKRHQSAGRPAITTYQVTCNPRQLTRHLVRMSAHSGRVSRYLFRVALEPTYGPVHGIYQIAAGSKGAGFCPAI